MNTLAKATILALVVALGASAFTAIRANRKLADRDASMRLLESQRDDLQRRLAPLEAKQRAVTRINQEFVVPANTIQPFDFSPPLTPGTLAGTWRSSGQGFGGADDTI